MKTCKALLLVFSFTFLATITYAQFNLPRYKDVAEIKNLQPIIIINPPNDDIVKKYDRKSKPEVVQTYEQLIDNYNNTMAAMMKKFWTFNSKEPLFKTRAEVKEITKTRSEKIKYFIIYCYSYESSYTHDFDWRIDKGGERVVGTYTHFAVGFLDEPPFYDVMFPDLLPTPKYIAYMISNTNVKFNYVESHKDNGDYKQMISKNAHLLSGKTLLISKDQVSPKVMGDIGSYYSCSYRLVSDDEMNQAVASGDSASAYVIRCNGSVSNSGMTMGNTDINWIINCADGVPIGYTTKGTSASAGKMFTTVTIGDAGLRKDFFQDIASLCAGSKK